MRIDKQWIAERRARLNAVLSVGGALTQEAQEVADLLDEVERLRRKNAALQAENDRLLEKCNRLHEERDHYREIAHRAGVGLPESSGES